MMEFVSWDDFSIPNMMGKSKKSMVPKHQPEYFSYHVEKKTPFTLLDLPHPSGRYPTSRKVLVDGSDYARQTREGQP